MQQKLVLQFIGATSCDIPDTGRTYISLEYWVNGQPQLGHVYERYYTDMPELRKGPLQTRVRSLGCDVDVHLFNDYELAKLLTDCHSERVVVALVAWGKLGPRILNLV